MLIPTRLRVSTAITIALMVSSPAFGQAPVPLQGATSAQQPPAIPVPISRTPSANSQAIPGQILRTGINLNTAQISANSSQLADQLKLTPVLEEIEALRAQVGDGPITAENALANQRLLTAQLKAQTILHECELAVDFTIAELGVENQIYNELASTWQARANKLVQYSNWGSYYSNGALWAVAEALDIPTWKRPKYAISSGTVGIIAGVMPSLFSLYGMHAANGRKYPGEGAPNMLAKVFGTPGNAEVDYPTQIWTWLNTVPPDDATGKTRKDQLIDRWVADSNIPAFTDPSAKSQINALSGNTTDKRALTISLMQTRTVMLSQLSAEILKMKRMLLELSMVTRGEKQV